MQPRLFQPDSDPLSADDVSLTVWDVVRLYLNNTQAEQEARTFDGRKRHLEAFANVHGLMRLSSAKPYHLKLWMDSQSQWRSDWTKKGAVSSVQRAFNWAVKLGIIDRNPFWGVAHRGGEYGRAMTDAEFRSALRASSSPFRRVLMFLRYTGCRPSELAAIQPEDVDLDRSLVVLAKHKSGNCQTIRKPRVIVMHPVAKSLAIYLLRTMIPDQDRLFINSRGSAWTRYALGCRMKRLRRQLGLPARCRLYGLRHKFGTDAIKNKVELKTLAVLMGHATTRMTERYVHVENEFKLLGDAVRQALKPIEP